MRIERLSLDPWGGFRDRHLVLDPTKRFHVVVGRNEAGKSTTLRALSALLFGVGDFSKDEGASDKPRLRGQFLLENGERVTIVRERKRKKFVASDDEGREVSDATLSELRGHVDLAAFRNTYGLTLSSLQEGSKDLLLVKSEAGATLLSGRLGGLRIHDVESALAGIREPLYKAEGRKADRALPRALDAYKKALANAEAATSSPESLLMQRKALLAAETEVDDLRERANLVRAELVRCRGALQSKEAITARQRLHVSMDALGQDETMSEELTERILRAYEAKERDEASLASKRSLRERLEARLSELPEDDRILSFSTELEWLDQQASVHAEDERQHRVLTEALSELAEPGAPMGEALEGADLGDLLEEANAILHRVQDTRIKREMAVSELLRIEDDIERLSATRPAKESVDTRWLQASIHALEKSSDAFANAELAHEKHRVRVESKLAAMPTLAGRRSPFSAGVVATFASRLPRYAVTEAHASDLHRLEDELGRIEDELTNLSNEEAEVRDRLRSLDEEGKLPTEGDLLEARAARDTLAKASSRSNASKLAEAIERADRIVDDLRAHAAKVSERALHTEHLEALRETKGARLLARAEVEEAHRLARAAFRTMFPDELEEATDSERCEWARFADEWRPLDTAAREAEVEVQHLGKRVSADLASLAEAMGDHAPSRSLPPHLTRSVLPQARALLEAALHSANECALFERELKNMDHARVLRSRELSALEMARTREQEQWTSLTTRYQLPSGENEGRNAIASALLSRESQTKRAAILRERSQIEGRIELYASRLQRVRQACTPPGSESLPTLAQCLARLVRAKELFAEREALVRERNQVSLEEAAQVQALAWAENELDRARTDGESDARLAERAHTARERKRLRHELRILDGQLAHLDPIDVPAVAAAETDEPRLQADLSALEDQLRLAERKAAQLRVGVESYEHVRDDAAEARAMAESHHEEARALARQWAVSALASRMLARALTLVRKETEGPVLERAGRYFEHMTAGRYRGIRVEINERGSAEIVAERDSGERLPIDRLSDGARDQLYLAVRLGSLVHARENGGPELPLVIDDVLMAFDDERARLALDLFLELQDVVEIVYFTHHDGMRKLLEMCAKSRGKERADDVADVIVLPG